MLELKSNLIIIASYVTLNCLLVICASTLLMIIVTFVHYELMITETLHIRGNLPNLGGRVAHNMTFQSESHMEALEPRTPIVHPKTQLRIGNWNVRTLYAQGRTAQAAKAMREAKLQIMGIMKADGVDRGSSFQAQVRHYCTLAGTTKFTNMAWPSC